jgi:hypothetical protein
MNETQIYNIDAGFRAIVKHILSSGIRVLESEPINEGRYYLIKVEDGKNYLAMFKRDFFHNFGKEFRDQGASGMGETINTENLKSGLAHGVNNLMFIYPDGAIYSISVEDFLNKSFRRVNKENKETLSVSIHELRRENK